MKCPKCGTEQKELVQGQIIAVNTDQCVICGFNFTSSDEEKFLKHCSELIMREIANFKRTGYKDHVYKADVFLQAMIAQIDDDLPMRPEVSK